MQYFRKMGIDYGDKRIGIAFTDLLCIISSAYEVYKNTDTEVSLRYLAKLAKEKSVDEIIMGLPLQMDGTEGDRAKVTREFGDRLSQISGLPINYVDERLSSVEADEILKEAGYGWEKRKELLDKVSAQVILQTYLDVNGLKNKK